jgi:ribosomal protein S18 acetylase RimI-like enzyme
MSTDVLIQELEPKDLPGVAAVHLMAFPKSALTMLGSEAVRRYYEWQLLGPHEVSALSACVNSELVGFCFAGIFRGAMSGFVRKNRTFLITQVIAHPWLVTNPIFRDRLTIGTRVLKSYAGPRKFAPVSASPAPNHFGILAIAVDPQRQGLGIGKLLMRATEDVARQRGFHEINLSVNPRNQQAVEFYERLNWKRFSKENVWKGEMKKSLASG